MPSVMADACAVVTAHRADLDDTALDIIAPYLESFDDAVPFTAALAWLGAELERYCVLEFSALPDELCSLGDLIARSATRGDAQAVYMLAQGATLDELVHSIGWLVGWSLDSIDNIEDASPADILACVATTLAVLTS